MIPSEMGTQRIRLGIFFLCLRFGDWNGVCVVPEMNRDSIRSYEANRQIPILSRLTLGLVK